MNKIPIRSCFLELADAVYVITNWRYRLSDDDVVILLKLGPRHQRKYGLLKAQGRGQKTIYYHLFPLKRPVAIPPRAARGPRPAPVVRKASIDIAILTREQLGQLIDARLPTPIASLATLPIADLRKLFWAVTSMKG